MAAREHARHAERNLAALADDDAGELLQDRRKTFGGRDVGLSERADGHRCKAQMRGGMIIRTVACDVSTRHYGRGRVTLRSAAQKSRPAGNRFREVSRRTARPTSSSKSCLLRT